MSFRSTGQTICSLPPGEESPPPTQGVVVLGHGSRLKEAASELLQVADALAQRLPTSHVRVAYGELCEPTLPQVILELVALGTSRIVVLPFFLSLGRHVQKDVPEQLRQLREQHPGLELLLGEHLGYDDRLVDILQERLSAALLPSREPGGGFVSLVGAGPGDPELLTLKGAKRLREADVVVHDDLVPTQVMERYAPGARRIDVGKRKGRCFLRQEEINALLVRLAREGHRVVRLKGGDPCLFGRAEEERQALREAGVGHELVAGVSSLAAVPAAAGIVVTNRDNARSLGAFSLHKRDGKPPSEAEWEQMAKGPDTLVLFMGRTILREACEKLVAWGRAPETPAALIVEGTLPGQQVVRGTLQTLPELAASLVTEGPGLIVVGAACGG